jgi:hypothetical protein
MTKTQTSDILQHLKDGRRLTQKEAINEYGAYRLSSIIYSLRKQGHDIVSIPIDVPTRYKKEDGTPRMANVVEYKFQSYNDYDNGKKTPELTQQLLDNIKPNKEFDRGLQNFINSIIQ